MATTMGTEHAIIEMLNNLTLLQRNLADERRYRAWIEERLAQM
jgi:hypothetical protein